MRITAPRMFIQCVDERPRRLTRIDTDDGTSGWGECYDHGPYCGLPPLLEYLFREIVGEDPRRVGFLILMLNQKSRFPPGMLGLAAIPAIDHALVEIATRALGVPVYMLLGGSLRDRVRIYCGVYAAPDPKAALNESHGYTSFKFLPYRSDMHSGRWDDLVHDAGSWFARIRELTPTNFEFAVDVHFKIWEPCQAVQIARALEPHDLLFFEESIRLEHIPAWARRNPKSRWRGQRATRSISGASSCRC